MLCVREPRPARLTKSQTRQVPPVRRYFAGLAVDQSGILRPVTKCTYSIVLAYTGDTKFQIDSFVPSQLLRGAVTGLHVNAS